MKVKQLFLIFLVASFVSLSAQTNTKSALQLHKEQYFKKAAYLSKPLAVQANHNQFDALFYEIHLALNYDEKKIKGWVEGRFRVLTDSLDALILDLKQNMSVNSVQGPLRSYLHQADYIEIELNRSFYRDEIVSVVIDYEGMPSSPLHNYFKFDTMPDGSEYAWTLSEPYGAKYWWPCKDTPADKADSVSIFITVPENQVVGSNGILRSETDNGDGTKEFHWFEKYPITTYLVSLVAGKYAQFQEYYKYSDQDSMLLDYYVFPEFLEETKSSFSEMSDYLDALSYYFGPYPFLEEKYGMAQFGRGGGMEHQTLTSVGRVNIESRYLFVHELGHQWFGDAVTCATWTDIWLNEGFASYSEALYAEWAGFNGFEPGYEAYQAYMFTQYYNNGGTIFIQDTTVVANIFNRIVYDKGSWVLHMLRRVLGDDVFFDVLKSYVSDLRWQYGSVRTEDFRTICEEKSGLDLGPFFDQWLNYPYYPVYAYSWSVRQGDQGDFVLDVHLEQKQHSVVYKMPIDLYLIFRDGSDTTIVVMNDLKEQDYRLNLRDLVVEVIPDPNHWILRDIQILGEDPFTADIKFKHIFPNPFTDEVHIHLFNAHENSLALQIYNSSGEKIRKLKTENLKQFFYYYKWDGRNETGIKVASGVYFVRPITKTNFKQEIGKVVLLK